MQKIIITFILLFFSVFIIQLNADVVILSSGSTILGTVRKTDEGVIVEVEQGKFSLDSSKVEYISKSENARDTYFNAASRLLQEGKNQFALKCITRSIAEEAATKAAAEDLKADINERLKAAAQEKAKKIKKSEHPLEKAARLKEKAGQLQARAEALNSAKLLDSNRGAGSDLAEKHLEEAKALMKQAKHIEEQYRQRQASRGENKSFVPKSIEAAKATTKRFKLPVYIIAGIAFLFMIYYLLIRR
jgi:hypothetical protein